MRVLVLSSLLFLATRLTRPAATSTSSSSSSFFITTPTRTTTTTTTAAFLLTPPTATARGHRRHHRDLVRQKVRPPTTSNPSLIITTTTTTNPILSSSGIAAPLRAAAPAADGQSSGLEDWINKWTTEQQEEGGGETKAPKTTSFPHTSLAEVLAEIFDQVLKSDKEGDGKGTNPQHLLLFPNAKALQDSNFMRQFGDHLDLCKECCEILGVSQNSLIMHPGASGSNHCPVPGILIKPIPQGAGEIFSDDDPYWNDDDDDGTSPFSALFNDEEDAEAQEHEKLYQVPEDDTPIMVGMKAWVDAVIADLGVCPFTLSAEEAGLPRGAIRYFIDRSVSPEEIYRRYWQEVALISSDSAQAQNEKQLSTTLLITPNFGMRNREFFETFSGTLTQPLEALALEEEIQLVFFHPEWVFRDGADRMGNEDAANYARRSPWPMINILRTPQVRKAQKAIPTGLVYRQNEVTLDKIGSRRLQKWLVERDWGDVKDNFRVDRKTVPILSTAQELLQGLSPEALSVDEAVVAPPSVERGVAKAEEEEEERKEEKEGKNGGGAAGAAAGGVEGVKKGFFGGGWENEFGLGGEEEDDEDDWDKPLPSSRALLDMEDDEETKRVKRPVDEMVEDARGLIALLRTRLNSKVPLTPAEIYEFEERAKRTRKD